MKRLALIIVIVVGCAAMLPFDKDKCVDGHGGPKKCVACGCGGEVDKMKTDPKEPGGNATYPNLKCRQACSPSCCACAQEKKSSNPFRDNSYDGTGADKRPREMYLTAKPKGK